MNIKILNPVLPNFIKSLSVIFISVISMTAYANHHEQKNHTNMDATEKAKTGTEVMLPKTDKAPYTATTENVKKSGMSEEEINALLEEEKLKSEMQRLMDEGGKKVSEEIVPE